MPALQKKHKKSSVHNIKSVMNTRYGPSRIIGFHEIRSIKRFWVVGNWYFY